MNENKTFSALRTVMEDNDIVLRALSEYLNRTPRFLDAKTVTEFAGDCKIPLTDAFRALFVAACGLNLADNARHRRLERQYFQTGLHCLRTEDYRSDAYLQTIRFPAQKRDRWEFCTHAYAPFEPFACSHPVVTPDLREIPQIGYFTEEYVFPAVLENGVEWMTVTPNEVETMKEPIRNAHGRVLTLGLGLGYYAFHVLQKPDVTHLTVIERDPGAVSLFCDFLLPQFPHTEKLEIVTADAFDFMKNPRQQFDSVFCDLWHDASDGLELYLRLRRLERAAAPQTPYSYWIEPSLLSALRRMVYERITDPASALQLRGADPYTILSDSFLRSLDPLA